MGGVGKVNVLWETPLVDPDPDTTKYRLYVTPEAPPSDGRRRLQGPVQTSVAELAPLSGAGTTASPFNASVYLPGGLGWEVGGGAWEGQAIRAAWAAPHALMPLTSPSLDLHPALPLTSPPSHSPQPATTHSR